MMFGQWFKHSLAITTSRRPLFTHRYLTADLRVFAVPLTYVDVAMENVMPIHIRHRDKNTVELCNRLI